MVTSRETWGRDARPERKTLRDTLARLYGDIKNIQRVARDAGVVLERIDFNGSALVIWESVLDEVDRLDVREELLAVVREEYPDDPSLPGRAAYASSEDECPYPGLAFFDEEQGPLFFGRSDETREALAGLGAQAGGYRRWLQIEGASGSGKSSLLRAGVVPSVRRGGVVGGPGTFRVAVMRPGRDATRNLAVALSRAFPTLELAHVQRTLADSDEGLGIAVNGHLPAGCGLLLVIDQLEEVFTLAAEKSEVLTRFDRLLDTALGVDHLAVFLATSIRSDFVGRFRALPRLERRLNHASRYYLPAIGERALRESIVEPARIAGLDWEQGLVDRIVEDALQVERGEADKSSALPLVANALRLLWERRQGRTITSAAYQELRGVAGALGEGAGAVLRSLDADGRACAETILLGLVQIYRGAPPTRRPVARDSLLEAAGGAARAERVLVRLSGGRDPNAPVPSHPVRLVTVTREGNAPEEHRVDLVHEALLREWDALRGWIERDRQHLLARGDLENHALRWKDNRSVDDFLLTSGQLAMFEEHHFGQRELTAAARELMERSERRRSLARTRNFAVVFVVMAASFGAVLIMAELYGRARDSARAARRNAQAAERSARAAQANEREANRGVWRGNAAMAKLLADETGRREEALALAIDTVAHARAGALSDDDPEVLGAMLSYVVSSALTAFRARCRVGFSEAVPLGDGSLVAATFTENSSGDGEFVRLDMAADTIQAYGRTSRGELVAFDGSAALLSIENERRTTLPTLVDPLSRGGAEPRVIARLPAGIAAMLSDRARVLWYLDLTEPQEIKAEAHQRGAMLVFDARDGRILGEHPATRDEWNRVESEMLPGTVANYASVLRFDGRIRSARTHLVLHEFRNYRPDQYNGWTRSPIGLARDESALYIARGTRMSMIDLRTHVEREIPSAESWGTITDMALSPDGGLAATVTDDLVLQVQDVRTGERVRPLGFGHHVGPLSVRFSADGRHVATSGADGTVRVWEARGSAPPRIFRCVRPDDGIGSMHAADCVRDPALRSRAALFDGGSQELLRTFPSPGSRPLFLDRGEMLAIPDRFDQTMIRIWDTRDGHLSRVVQVPHTTSRPAAGGSPARLLDVSPGLAYAAIESGEELELHQLGASPRSTRVTPFGSIPSGTFSRDGAWFATSSNQYRVSVWDVRAALAHPLVPAGLPDCPAPLNEWASDRVSFSPDGHRLLSMCPGRAAVRIWDLQEDQVTEIQAPDGGMLREAEFMPDGAGIIANQASRVLLWRTPGGQPVITERFDSANVRFHVAPDGEHVAIYGHDFGVTIWNLRDPPERASMHPLSYEWGSEAVFSPDGRLVAVDWGDTIRIWRMSDWQVLRTYHLGGQSHVQQFAPDGRSLLVMNDTGAFLLPLRVDDLLMLGCRLLRGRREYLRVRASCDAVLGRESP